MLRRAKQPRSKSEERNGAKLRSNRVGCSVVIMVEDQIASGFMGRDSGPSAALSGSPSKASGSNGMVAPYPKRHLGAKVETVNVHLNREGATT